MTRMCSIIQLSRIYLSIDGIIYYSTSSSVLQPAECLLGIDPSHPDWQQLAKLDILDILERRSELEYQTLAMTKRTLQREAVCSLSFRTTP